MNKIILTALTALTLTACQSSPTPVDAGYSWQVSHGPEQVAPATDLTVQHGAMLDEAAMAAVRSGAVQSITVIKGGESQSLAWRRLIDVDGQAKVQIVTREGNTIRTWTADLEYLLQQIQLFLVNDVPASLVTFVTGE